MTPRLWTAAIGLGIGSIGPLLCFLLYAIGRDGHTALGFALIFLGMGFIVVWVAGQMDDGGEPDDAEKEDIEAAS